MHECFPKHSRMGTARMKSDKETDEEGKKRIVSLESGHKQKKSRRPITSYSKYNNNKHNMVIFYKNWKKYNEKFNSEKNKMDLNIQKMKNHPPSPVYFHKYLMFFQMGHISFHNINANNGLVNVCRLGLVYLTK